MDETTMVDTQHSETSSVTAERHDLVLEELLVEEISIDGMCGVY